MSTRMHVGDVSHLGSNRHSFFSMDGTQQSPQLWLGPETEVAAELDGNSFPAVPVFSPKAQRRYQNSFSIKMLPYTTNEWKKALADIKRDYTNKRYRPCSTRCAELLQNVQHPVRLLLLCYTYNYSPTNEGIVHRNLFSRRI